MIHFEYNEFDSPDLPGSGQLMQDSTLQMLDDARAIAGVPFIINSGFRSYDHNKKVGGVKDSPHLGGWAADIKVTSSRHRWIILNSLLAAGFDRIGIGATFIHADNDPKKAKNVIWTY